MIDQAYDLAARNSLANRTVDLDELEQNLRKIGTLSASEIKAALKNASEALHESAAIIRDHAVGESRVSNDVLKLAASTITAAHEVLDAIIFSEARRAVGVVHRS
jgi:flagellar motor switch protein FliM